MRERIFELDSGSRLCDYLDKHDVEKIYYRHGVWNDYKLIDYNRDELFNDIRYSAAGANLTIKNSNYFVSIPAASDMW